MRTRTWVLIPISTMLALMLMSGWSCGPGQPIEMTARDTIAVAKAGIQRAQTKYKASCTLNPAQTPCRDVNRAVGAQNLLVDGLEAYCGGPGFDAGTAPCEVHSGAQAKLQSALKNMNQVAKDVKDTVN